MKPLIPFLLLIMSLAATTPAPAQTDTHAAPGKIYGLVIHGGAGAQARKDATPEDEKIYHAKLQEALDAGYAVLDHGGAALDAVVAAINVMENAGIFDAGKGSVFNAEGFCEMDAAIMDGHTLAAGSVGGAQHARNPITLARAVMEKTSHVMLVGEGADKFAQSLGMEVMPRSYFQTERRRRQWEKLKEAEKKDHASFMPHGGFIDSAPVGTVGCAALDQNGNLAAGTSTGGTANKKAGRVGDSPIIGAGTYANNATCAISGTGQGEFFMREVFSHTVSDLMEYKGLTLAQAAAEAMARLEKLGGHGGCIAMDRAGNITMPFNTAAMYRGFKLSNGKSDVQLFE